MPHWAAIGWIGLSSQIMEPRMKKSPLTLTFGFAMCAALSVAAPAGLQGQEAANRRSAAELDRAYATIAGEASDDVEKRDRVSTLLASPEVAGVAEEAGLDIETARSAVGLLSGDRLDSAVRLTDLIEDQLAGGQTITIRSTTIIIILLVVIILLIT